MKSLCLRAQVKPFGFHAIRHLAASVMAAGDLRLPEIQSLLRHQKTDTTSRYLHRVTAHNAMGRKLDNVLVLPIKRNPQLLTQWRVQKKVNHRVNHF